MLSFLKYVKVFFTSFAQESIIRVAYTSSSELAL